MPMNNIMEFISMIKIIEIYLRLAPYLVRSSTGSSFVANDDNVVWSASFNDISSVCSLWLSFGITVIVDDDDDDDNGGILVVEVSSTDGVVIDKAAGIWKSLTEKPETILIGAWRRKEHVCLVLVEFDFN